MEMMRAVARIEQKLDSFCTMSLDHDHFINGNGVEGAKVRIDRIEQVVKGIKWAGITIGGVLLTTITGGVIAMTVWWIRTSGH
jgi:hypothetical protein